MAQRSARHQLLTIFYDPFDQRRLPARHLDHHRPFRALRHREHRRRHRRRVAAESRFTSDPAHRPGVHPVLPQHAAAGPALLLLFRARQRARRRPTGHGQPAGVSISAGLSSRFPSSPARSMSRSSAQASRRCPRPRSRRPNRSATRGSAPIAMSCCRSRSASACRRSTTTSSTSSRRRRSPTRSRAGDALHGEPDLVGQSSMCREMMNVAAGHVSALVGVLVWIMGRWERAMKLPGIGR